MKTYKRKSPTFVKLRKLPLHEWDEIVWIEIDFGINLMDFKEVYVVRKKNKAVS